ncbi:MAG: TRAP transporter small permease subunit [Woeseiaceae bacterium]|nr:TRAP transporter small permease subunit [Woeseiaceae bacterium]
MQAKGGQATIIDRLSELTGRLTAWLTLAMVLVTCLVVVLRYVFDIGFIWLQESVTWMHAVVFMLGAAYTLEHEEHVRVDVFYRRFGERGRAVVDLLGVVLFLLPLCGWIGWSSWDFVATSWRIGEASRESGGLPYPMVPLLKSVLVVMPAALALQGLSLGLRSFRALSLEPGGDR